MQPISRLEPRVVKGSDFETGDVYVRVRLRDRADAKRVQVPRLSRRHVSRRHVPHTNKLNKKKNTINNRRSLSQGSAENFFSVGRRSGRIRIDILRNFKLVQENFKNRPRKF